MEIDKIYQGDCLEVLKTFEDNSIDCCVTSPPYYALRDYGADRQIGLEETPEKYIEKMTEVFMEVYRVLKPEGTLWLNIGDSYNSSPKGNTSPSGFQSKSYGINDKSKDRASKFKTMLANGIKPKDLIGIPWMLAFSLRNAGWYLRQDIIWHKPNPMPESVTDRCTKSHEYIFLMSKSQKYYFDHESIQEPSVTQGDVGSIKFGGTRKYGDNDGCRPNSMHIRRELGLSDEVYTVRNKRDVWSINVKPCKEAHFATYPPELVSTCILAGCPEGGIVLDPFMGSGTTGIVANKLGRHYVGIELNPQYVEMAKRRIGLEESQIKLF